MGASYQKTGMLYRELWARRVRDYCFVGQQQSNGVDCGVFAIAFISYILSQHKSPIDAKFNSSKMRPHLLHCSLEDKVTEFPRTEHAINKCFEKTIK